ncbi:hemolysin III family protein [Sutterella sp.]|uniref:PAQR family membrane homeostasis protein TrhA n=1 Tax=Sutterella sp. TaxID=1981025 RepID=UPI0026E10863|nr:hemolysin III family protein [Sutterella sp.]MDO5531386.1 hemolysin III family protein [Sutterella sp.]
MVRKHSRKSALRALGRYSLGEEIANAVTHGVAAILSIVALVLMIIFSVKEEAGPVALVSIIVFGAAMIILYTISTLYHALPQRKAKRVLQVLDHSAIYILIAGSYTPFCLITLGGLTGTILCTVVWTIALAGAVLQPILLRHADWINCVLCLVLGWCIIFVIKPLFDSLPAGGLWLLGAGGLVYSVGVIFYLWDRLPFNHAIWHVFVLAGTTLQFLAVLLYVIPSASALAAA